MPWSAPVSAVEETFQIEGDAGLADVDVLANVRFARQADVTDKSVF
jgi:hypothetical protein